MTLNPRPLSRMFRLPRRHRRPGSVLILVIVLLVLLALIGTAYVSTSRSDRAASQQGLANAQTDQLADGGASIAQGTILSSLFVNDIYRPSVAGYNHFDATSTSTTANDDWLADRVPLNGGTAAAPVPYWPAITRPLVGLNFESPDGTVYTERLGLQAPANGLKIDAVTVNYGSDSMVYPAFTDATTNNKFIAGDADGDGIADCGLVRLPGTFIDGLTYYAGFRIIDNNSTVNANTAMSMMGDYAPTNTPGNAPQGSDLPGNTPPPNGPSLPNYGIFPTNVGLAEMLGTAAEAAGLANYRLGPFAPNITTPLPNNSDANSTPFDEQIPPASSGTPAQFVTQPFNFVTQGDALFHQAISRLDNPGVNYQDQANPIINARYQTLPLTDQAALAYHFCLINPSASISMTESLLRNSAYNATPNYSVAFRAYSPNQFTNWYTGNFAYPAPAVDAWKFSSSTPPLSIRTLLSTRNPVSNAIPVVTDPNYGAPTAATPTTPAFLGEPVNTGMLPYDASHFKGAWVSGTKYNYGDVVTTTYQPAAPANYAGHPLPPTYERTYLYVGTSGAASSAAPTTPPTAANPWVLQPWSSVPVKASVNTGTFPELWRAFWCVMSGAPTSAGNLSPFDATPDQNPYNPTSPLAMFKSPIRDPNFSAIPSPNGATTPATPAITSLSPIQVVQVRAALAALNAQYLRSGAAGGNNNVLSKKITLGGTWDSASKSYTPQFDVELFANAPQPFITEVYVNTNATANDPNYDSGPNTHGYVAVELYNPYPFDISIAGWQLAVVDRRQPSAASPTPAIATPFPQMQFQTITGFTGFPAATVIPAGKGILLENYDHVNPPADPNAHYRSASSGLPKTGPLPTSGATASIDAPYYVPNLHEVINSSADGKSGGELFLLRPRNANGTLSASIDPTDSYNEANAAGTGSELEDLVPVDSFDFTNLQQGTTGAAPTADVWHYARGKGATSPNAWKCVYSGLYDGTQQTNGSCRQQAETHSYIPSGPTSEPPLTVPATFGVATAAPSYNYPYAPIEICNTGLPGPNAAPAGTAFPFGGFARNGDILNVPYIGAYRIRELQSNGATPPSYLPLGWNAATGRSPAFCEMNTLPMDAFFAADGAVAAVAVSENIGRFCPYVANANYNWCEKLFDYVTVQAPTEDYFPNIDPSVPPDPARPPVPVFNADGTTTTQREEWNIGVEGLININTAPLPVLARLPLVMNRTGSPNFGKPDLNASYAMAQAIINDRQSKGPFQSIFDLNRVPGFATENGTLTAAITDYDGDLAAILNGTSGVSAYPDGTKSGGTQQPSSTGLVGDYRHDFAVLNRISNLITTRSDTFTVYVVVEGWQNVGTTAPRRVTQKHTAFILDRTGVSQLTRTLKTVTVPTD